METFAQPKITGYRQLSEAEANLMNRIKADGEIVEHTIDAVILHIADQRYTAKADAASDESTRLDHAQPERWVSIARTHLQQGLMALTRAVAQPSSF